MALTEAEEVAALSPEDKNKYTNMKPLLSSAKGLLTKATNRFKFKLEILQKDEASETKYEGLKDALQKFNNQADKRIEMIMNIMKYNVKVEDWQEKI